MEVEGDVPDHRQRLLPDSGTNVSVKPGNCAEHPQVNQEEVMGVVEDVPDRRQHRVRGVKMVHGKNRVVEDGPVEEEKVVRDHHRHHLLGVTTPQ